MVTVEQYMATLREKAATVGPIEQFYVGMFDETLYEMEQDLDGRGKNSELYDQGIIPEYRRWLAALTDEERQQLIAFNSAQNSANRNWLVEELLEENESLVQ